MRALINALPACPPSLLRTKLEAQQSGGALPALSLFELSVRLGRSEACRLFYQLLGGMGEACVLPAWGANPDSGAPSLPPSPQSRARTTLSAPSKPSRLVTSG